MTLSDSGDWVKRRVYSTIGPQRSADERRVTAPNGHGGFHTVTNREGAAPNALGQFGSQFPPKLEKLPHNND